MGIFRFVIIATAFLLSLFGSISLPNFGSLDLGRVVFKNGNNGVAGTKTIRFGVWSFCTNLNSTDANPCDAVSPCNSTVLTSTSYCTPQHYGYTFTLLPIESTQTPSPAIHVSASWSRGLAIHPAFTIFLFIAMLRPGAHSLFSFCASIVGFITVIIDTVYLQNVENIMKKVGISHSIDIGAGMILTILAFLLSFVYLMGTPQASTQSARENSWKSRLRPRLYGNPRLPNTSSISRLGSYLPTTTQKHFELPVVNVQNNSSTSQDSSGTLHDAHLTQNTPAHDTSEPQTSLSRASTLSLPLYMPGSFKPSPPGLSTPQAPEPAHSASYPRRSSISSVSSVTTTSTSTHRCPLCYEKRGTLSSTPCGHLFCTQCIVTALDRDPRCPLCRGVTTRADLRDVYLSA